MFLYIYIYILKKKYHISSYIFLVRYINLFLLFCWYFEILSYLVFKFLFEHIEKSFLKKHYGWILNYATRST